MEIDITSLLKVNQFYRSQSQMEGGSNAGANTWQQCLDDAEETVLLDTEEKLEAFRDWLEPFGAWNKEEIAAMDNQHLNALFLQWVAGDCREAGADSLDSIDWEDYHERCKAGQCAGNLFKGDIEGEPSCGRIYFSLSS